MVIREIKAWEGMLWGGIGVFVCILSWRFELGSFHEPGAGFMAFFSGLFLCAIGLIMILSKVFSKKLQQEDGTAQAGLPVFLWRRLAYTAALLLFYVLFLEMLGYMIATFLLMWGMTYDWEKKNWFTSLLFSSITVVVSYLVFEVWLRCQLPHGIFPWW
jgi:putative tricarboxylic transport membrane protein